MSATPSPDAPGIPVAGGVEFADSSAIAVAELWDTTAQNVITTTEATLRNVLHKHIDALAAKDAWIAPATVLIPIIIALASGVKSQSGRYLLVFVLGATALWFAYAFKKALKYRRHGGIDAVIADLRPGSAPASVSLSRPKLKRPSWTKRGPRHNAGTGQ